MPNTRVRIDPLRRLLVLVPHEPELDPRIGWVLKLCRELGRTELVAATWSSRKPPVEYDGVVSVERVDVVQTAGPLALWLSSAAAPLNYHRSTVAFVERQGRPPASNDLRTRLDHHRGALLRLLANWGYYGLLLSALYRRGRSISVPPTAIVCHDIYSLLPGVLLKRRLGCALLYDSHEFFPESDLLAPRWQKRLIRALERPFIRRADAVVTISPPLARELERTYGLDRVASAPNAEPRDTLGEVAPPRPAATPIRFLLQGQASPGRGFERLFELWQRLDEDRAVLLVRCPEHEYTQELRERFGELFSSGRAVWLDPVPEARLVSAASDAHVGVIPYVGPSLNHLYACPNKLSQYMAAGTAILSNDLPYIASVLRGYDCGLTYRADDAESFTRAVRTLLDEPETLQRLRENAYTAARSRFNWDEQSGPYREALRRLHEQRR